MFVILDLLSDTFVRNVNEGRATYPSREKAEQAIAAIYRVRKIIKEPYVEGQFEVIDLKSN